MGRHPAGAVIRQGASWDQTVHMEVGVEELIPRMEDHDAAQLAAQILPAKLQQRLTGSRK
jgi:hypothetical protein